MATIGVSEAARMAGRDVSTLHRMMKSGRLAYTVDSQGRRRLDPAELGRVFDAGGMAMHGNGAVQSSAAPQREEAQTIALLREAVHCRDAMLEDLRRRLDASEEERRRVQERLTGLLTQRQGTMGQAGSVPAVQRTEPGAPWWRRWFPVSQNKRPAEAGLECGLSSLKD
jgi:hypothetical protein